MVWQLKWLINFYSHWWITFDLCDIIYWYLNRWYICEVWNTCCWTNRLLKCETRQREHTLFKWHTQVKLHTGTLLVYKWLYCSFWVFCLNLIYEVWNTFCWTNKLLKCETRQRDHTLFKWNSQVTLHTTLLVYTWLYCSFWAFFLTLLL